MKFVSLLVSTGRSAGDSERPRNRVPFGLDSHSLIFLPKRRNSEPDYLRARGYLWRQLTQTQREEVLEQIGRDEAERIWKEYAIRDYGRKWDDAAM